MILQSAAGALGGEVASAARSQILAPGPGHSPRDRSMAVWMDAAAPDGFRVLSHAGDDWRDCRDHVRQRLGISRGVSGQIAPKMPALGNDDRDKIEASQRIWHQGLDPRGTIVEDHLGSRGLVLPDEVAGEAIRFHPRCPWGGEPGGVPAMVACMRSIHTEEVTAVHRTRLTPEGRKVDRRMLGKASGSAIMLCPMSALGDAIAIGEGIETCLAAWQLGWSNVWALGSVGAIASFLALPYYSTLVVLAETDDGGASARASEVVGNRWSDAARTVYIVRPTVPGDLNDLREALAP